MTMLYLVYPVNVFCCMIMMDIGLPEINLIEVSLIIVYCLYHYLMNTIVCDSKLCVVYMPDWFLLSVLFLNLTPQSAVLPWHDVRPCVRPSVCLSVTLRYCDPIRWNTSNIISRLINQES